MSLTLPDDVDDMTPVDITAYSSENITQSQNPSRNSSQTQLNSIETKQPVNGQATIEEGEESENPEILTSPTIQRELKLFENSFWGKDDRGVEVLMTKMRRSKQISNDVKNLFTTRAAIEEEYGKKLMKLAKQEFCKDEIGSLAKGLSRTRTELESTARSHLDLSQKIRLELENPLAQLISKQRERRKEQAGIIERSSKSKSTKHSNLIKIKSKYHSERAKADGLEQIINSLSGKDLEKAQIRIDKVKQLKQEYEQLAIELSEVTRIWQHDWRVACREFQELEEQRIDFLKKILWEYVNALSSTCVLDDEAYERVRQALQEVNRINDLQDFIEERGTGVDPDFEVDGSPINEIPSLDSPLPEEDHSRFSLHKPVGLFKKAFNRPSSFGSHFGSSSSSNNNYSPSYGAGSNTSHTDLKSQSSTDNHNHIRPVNSIPVSSSNANLSSHSTTTAHKNASTPHLQTTTTTTNNINSSSSTANLTQNPSSSFIQANTTYPGNYSTTSINSTAQAQAQAPAPAPVVMPEPVPESPPYDPIPQISTNTQQSLFQVQAIYDYLKEAPEEISIYKGQAISVLVTHDDGWWEGETTDPSTGELVRGMFPSNFTVRA
ncbi:hypothetical protein CONCODRAFT_52169 [Conidiobolus coronatus NRRL 28638]|uniref:SH3 domain-containing protein n=1 Tax=Conidiobolus coronatus (strain ATCC 28846 / CBS 209.66 / NRRL 28638) TaxID=796925 RepID=A0A137NYE6_CONC2|nr:hypothetical protein CONCODRAFT_52169 [Conidiobolus coronatus NRRL 28638]|eukprot:KXN67674.1 hypothetical protein CONCODRAFT_52169 [Conidiobolus coronatus NRRL 28638]